MKHFTGKEAAVYVCVLVGVNRVVEYESRVAQVCTIE